MTAFHPRRETTAIVVHCSYTTRNQDIGREDIERWHRSKNGWLAIGYHYVIKRDGTIQFGREPHSCVGAHVGVGGHNWTSVGVCMVGGARKTHKGLVDDDNFTEDQWASLHTLLDFLRRVYPDVSIVAHRDLDKRRTCPVTDIRARLPEEWFENDLLSLAD